MKIPTARFLPKVRAAREESLPDTGVLVIRTFSENEYGEQTPQETDLGPIACSFVPAPGDEIATADGTRLVLDAKAYLSLDYEGTADYQDRFRLTHRHGEALVAPQTYSIVGQPLVEDTSLVLLLKSVTL